MNQHGFRMKVCRLCILIATVPLLLPVPGFPQVESKLFAGDPEPGAEFGLRVGISGVFLVATAPDEASTGTAYVFENRAAGWMSFQKLTPSVGSSGGLYGAGVSIDADVVAVGALGEVGQVVDAGAVYVYRFDGVSWNEEQRLEASDGASGDQFGAQTAVSGDVIVVPAKSNDSAGTNAGAAYVFRYDGTSWLQEQKLLASDGAADDGFGHKVAIDGDVLVVSSNKDDDAGAESGSAYVFRFSSGSWIQEAKLTATDAAADDRFGECVSIDGDRVLVGARQDDDSGSNSGSAYVFEYSGSGWSQTQKLGASDGSAGDRLGDSCSIQGTSALVGATFAAGSSSSDSGAAYLFSFDGSSWDQELKVSASDGVSGDRFGESLRLDGFSLVVSARAHDSAGTDAGAVYVFEVEPPCLFGPESQPLVFSRSPGKPVLEAVLWESCGGSGSISIEVDQVSSAWIYLNGNVLFSPADFSGNTALLAAQVVLLEGENRLEVELHGKPGGTISVEFVGE